MALAVELVVASDPALPPVDEVVGSSAPPPPLLDELEVPPEPESAAVAELLEEWLPVAEPVLSAVAGVARSLEQASTSGMRPPTSALTNPPDKT